MCWFDYDDDDVPTQPIIEIGMRVKAVVDITYNMLCDTHNPVDHILILAGEEGEVVAVEYVDEDDHLPFQVRFGDDIWWCNGAWISPL